LGLLLLVAGSHAVAAPAPPVQAATHRATVLAHDNDNDDDEEFDEDDDSLEEFIDETVDAANHFWAGVFKERGKVYRAPKVVKAWSDQTIRSKCGKSKGSEHAYCAEEETVYFDMDSDDVDAFETLWDDDRAFVIVTTVGHEWGHHIQRLLGVFDIDTRSVEVENQADCLMGVFSNVYARTSDWVGRADLKDAIEDTRESGDDPDTPMAERTHGTPDQRVEAFMRGYRAKSVAVCGI